MIESESTVSRSASTISTSNNNSRSNSGINGSSEPTGQSMIKGINTSSSSASVIYASDEEAFKGFSKVASKCQYSYL